MLGSGGEVAMDLHPDEAMCRRLSRLRAASWGFSLEEAGRLAFWKWLAAQRGETSERGLLLHPQPSRFSWSYGLRVDDWI
jgi:hypothetical protein